MTRIIPSSDTLLKRLRVLNPCIFRYPSTPYFVEGVAPRDSGGVEPAQNLVMLSSEKEQFERNINSLRMRVEQIPQEIGQETAAIRARFTPGYFP